MWKISVLLRKPWSFSAPSPRPMARTSSAVFRAEGARKAAGSERALGVESGGLGRLDSVWILALWLGHEFDDVRPFDRPGRFADGTSLSPFRDVFPQRLPYESSDVDGVFVSHHHCDHIGQCEE
jgi:hypothetical protein